MKKNNTETLTGVPETLLIPLYAKYNETKRNDSIIKDEKAVEIVEKIEKMNYTDSNASNIVWSNQVGIAVRTELLDKATERYLRKNPNAIVVNLGAGLCTRFFRVDNSKLKWYELDLPEVESVWKKVFNETEKHKFLAYDVLDFSWMNELKLIKEKPFLFIAEGLFCYFEDEDVKKTILEI
ncbi:MAG: class I SAM-dependent methyltransferase, partial [Methanosarcinaceae archaeon]